MEKKFVFENLTGDEIRKKVLLNDLKYAKKLLVIPVNFWILTDL